MVFNIIQRKVTQFLNFNKVFYYYIIFSLLFFLSIETYFARFDYYDLFPLYDGFRYFIWGNLSFGISMILYNINTKTKLRNNEFGTLVGIQAGIFIALNLFLLSTKYSFSSPLFAIIILEDLLINFIYFLLGIVFCIFILRR